MVTTEYFVRGTEPLDFCTLHSPTHTTTHWPTLLAGTAPLAADDEDEVQPTPLATGGVSAAAPPPDQATADAPAPPRRGFWARIFGRGNGDAKKPESPK